MIRQSLKIAQQQVGFTLIEVIIVVVIVGVIASLGVPQFTVMYEKTRLHEGLQVLSSIRGAQKRYFLENGVYAVGSGGLNNLDITIGDLKYFKDAEGSNNNSGSMYVGKLVRDSATTNYTLTIKTDGEFTCSGAPCADFTLNY